MLSVIKKISKQLYPKGRAFKMPDNGIFSRLHSALAISESKADDDAAAIRYSILPDNPIFSTSDATDWERRLGIYSSGAVPLSDRELAIARKMNHPGTSIYRQNFRYLEAQLQAAGFDVHVYENRFPDGSGGYYTITPVGESVHSDTFLHGQGRHGGSFGNKIVNYISESLDAQFVVSPNYRSTFFIAGATLSDFADVLSVRKNEFRQLILQIKPAQCVGFLYVNYV